MSRQGINTQQKGCCSACDKPIVGQVITALGKTWHPEHFVCNHCQQELGTRNFFERDGSPYCETDYHNLFSPRCAYCNGPILDVSFANHVSFSSQINSWKNSLEMRDSTRKNLAYRTFLLRSMRPTIWRRGIPWARWQTLLSQRLLWHVRTQMQWMQSCHYGKLHLRIE